MFTLQEIHDTFDRLYAKPRSIMGRPEEMTVRLPAHDYGKNMMLSRHRDEYKVWLYATAIVTYTYRGWVIDVGEYYTSTTFRRINHFTGLWMTSISRAVQKRLDLTHQIGPVWVEYQQIYIPHVNGMLIPYDRQMPSNQIPVLHREIPQKGATAQFTKQLREIMNSIRARVMIGEFDYRIRAVSKRDMQRNWERLLTCAKSGTHADSDDVRRFLGVAWVNNLSHADFERDIYTPIHRGLKEQWLDWYDMWETVEVER